MNEDFPGGSRPVPSKDLVAFFETIGIKRTEINYAKLDAVDALLVATMAAEREGCAKAAEQYGGLIHRLHTAKSSGQRLMTVMCWCGWIALGAALGGTLYEVVQRW